jgi:uncharacterized repeat protein (TIGR01451 family)
VLSGSNLQNLNLPIDPNGIVYDAISRAPIPGATVTLATPSGAALPSACFYDANQQSQITLADGFYKFDLSFADPACPSGGSYLLQVMPPSARYLPGVSELIPPTSSAATAAFVVPSCPASVDDAVPATAQYCEATPSEVQPPAAAAPSATTYYLHLTFDSSLVPGSSQIFNNHIPLDLDLDQSVTITKTTPMINVVRGQLVPYVITVANGIAVNLTDVTVIDRFPAGFRYVEGSARLDGVPREPVIAGRELAWTGLDVTTDRRHELVLLLAVGSGVGEGEFVNHAQAMSALTGRAMSAEALGHGAHRSGSGARLHRRHRQGVRRREPQRPAGRGRAAASRRCGSRRRAACSRRPTSSAASTSPARSRRTKAAARTSCSSSTIARCRAASAPRPNNLQVQRATRGKALEFNFGALDPPRDRPRSRRPVFEPGTTEIRPIWLPRLELLMTELRAAPAVLRLSYLADVEDPQLVDARMKVLREQIDDAWKPTEGGPSYDLAIEPEVFWRRGEPTDTRERQGRAP